MADKELKCGDCGAVGETVKDTTCPYAEEIHDEVVDITVCSDCYYQRLMDI